MQQVQRLAVALEYMIVVDYVAESVNSLHFWLGNWQQRGYYSIFRNLSFGYGPLKMLGFVAHPQD